VQGVKGLTWITLRSHGPIDQFHQGKDQLAISHLYYKKIL